MFATTETVEIIDYAEDLAKKIIFSELGENYRSYYKKLKDDKEAQVLISQFTKMKERYEEVLRFGKYHPDYVAVRREMRHIKTTLDMNETISNFKKAENAVQHVLDEISVIFAHEVSTSIKVATGNPFFESKSCSGGCSTGGSCGCKTKK